MAGRELPKIKEIRQCGLVAGIEFEQGLGEKITLKAREYGLITRNILDTIVLMPPLSISHDEIDFAVEALRKASQ